MAVQLDLSSMAVQPAVWDLVGHLEDRISTDVAQIISRIIEAVTVPEDAECDAT